MNSIESIYFDIKMPVQYRQFADLIACVLSLRAPVIRPFRVHYTFLTSFNYDRRPQLLAHSARHWRLGQAPRAIHQRRKGGPDTRFSYRLNVRTTTCLYVCPLLGLQYVSRQCIPITVHCLETIKLMDNPGRLRRRVPL